MNRKSAIAAIDGAGILLVFPIGNRKEPPSIWSHFFPRKKMRWEWDESGDNGVADLWHLRSDLSTTRQVVYTKWYQGRATYFSKPLFTTALRALNPDGDIPESLSKDARRILDILESDSPLSTKMLKKMASLKGHDNEKRYQKALRELWDRLLIVAFGEVDDGAFPSLAVGATRVLFEDLWESAFKLDPLKAEESVVKKLDPENLFLKYFLKLRNTKRSPSETRKKRSEQESARRSGLPRVVRFQDL